MNSISKLCLLGGAGLLFGQPLMAQSVTDEVIEEKIETEEANIKITKVVDGLENAWGIDWLPDGRMLITERPGRFHIIDGENIHRFRNLPEIDLFEDDKTPDEGGNQGGLLDVAVHPDYQNNGWIYFTYSSPGDDDSNFSGDEDYATGTALARAKLTDDGTDISEYEVLYVQSPRTEPGRHYGSRIIFPGDGTVLFSIGDRGIRYPSQDLTDPAGSIIRLKEDGGAAEDNPFVNKEPGNLRPEIFSFGHRNNQGMVIHPTTGEIWASDHGPNGGDLLYKVEKGKNYGWPQVSYGTEYDTDEKIGIGREAPGVEKPAHIWEDNMAPSGLTFYTGEFQGWNGHLFSGSLKQKAIYRLVIENGEVTHDEKMLEDKIGRIRAVKQGPDGNLYVITDEEDSGVYKLEIIE
ncbi:PQQ-dependent sugar dehydrogenase [Litoribacter alkaliphilus]|uniref:PQQ-dependent sugar dehydrogenase n=1 Tax=Litoribacter ruber TaxID=702568 RepID=A0AAP2CKL8_9BACT|nr:PQQ-dependent sugar dehydrogenase [Litoribacter alkaliphilus]MBS9525434.1 PQQ-dependent sugar dehydrogenase [Litoribacter alkaliphilus]